MCQPLLLLFYIDVRFSGKKKRGSLILILSHTGNGWLFNFLRVSFPFFFFFVVRENEIGGNSRDIDRTYEKLELSSPGKFGILRRSVTKLLS